MYGRWGFAVLKVYTAQEMNAIERFAKGWLYRVLEKWTAGHEKALPLRRYHLWSRRSRIPHERVFRAGNRHASPDPKIRGILINKGLRRFLKQIQGGRYKLWDAGLGWLAFRFIRPGRKDGYPLSRKAWGPAADVVSCWIPILGHKNGGTLGLVPGSHVREYKKVMPKKSKFARNEYRLAAPVADEKLHRPRLKKGEIIVYHPGTLHTEDIRRGSLTRLSFEVRFKPE